MPILSETYYTVVEWPIPSHVSGGFIDFQDEGFRYDHPCLQLRCSIPVLLTRDGVNNALGGGDPKFVERVTTDCRIVPAVVTISAPVTLEPIPPVPSTPKFRLP